jgi:hypothetical protein
MTEFNWDNENSVTIGSANSGKSIFISEQNKKKLFRKIYYVDFFWWSLIATIAFFLMTIFLAVNVYQTNYVTPKTKLDVLMNDTTKVYLMGNSFIIVVLTVTIVFMVRLNIKRYISIKKALK